MKSEFSATVQINSLMLERKKLGFPAFNLGAGEPILNTPDQVKQAANKALEQNKTLYPPAQGLPELRSLAAAWLNKDFQAKVKENNILTTNGGKFGLYLIFQLLLKKGDEVILPCPYWASYPSLVKLFGGRIKTVKTSEQTGWKITAQQFKKACGKKTKILILNSANNPTGALYSRPELEAILREAKLKKIVVISDEVYSGLVYDGKKFVSCLSFPRFKQQVVVIQSCSKNFAMTGWRLGFVIARTPIIKELTGLLSQSTSGVTTISQWAAVAALKTPKKFINQVRNVIQSRRDVLISELNRVFKLNLKPSESALYLFIKMSDLGIKATDYKEYERSIKDNFLAKDF